MVLCLKDVSKENAANNYRPISCLPLMWKLLSAEIAEEMYKFLVDNGILSMEQKCCGRKCKGTKGQLLRDEMVMPDCKRCRTNLGMVWIDYHKAFDMIPHSSIIESLDMFRIAGNVIYFQRSMESWKTELTSCGQSLGTLRLKRGVFQEDTLKY
eukprot:XP_014780241.1 PREDICTED: uncharacterized protein LOC106876265 [Octopus bimaculoides]